MTDGGEFIEMDPPELESVKVYLKNNKELPPNIMEDLQKGLATPRQELADIEAEIGELTRRLTQLETKRDQVKKYIDRYSCVLAPIRRIPVDILHNIFYHCLPTWRDPMMSAKEAPLLLTRVCRAWRQTAHASPPLWAGIYITFSDGFGGISRDEEEYLTEDHVEDTLRLRCSAVEQWLSRSGRCPLSISLRYTSRMWLFSGAEGSIGNTEHTLTLFRLLARFSTRWRRLELNMPVKVYDILARMVPASQLPMLNCIKIRLSFQTGISNPDTEVPFLQAPNIRRIFFADNPTDVSLRKTRSRAILKPTLAQLTNLSIYRQISVIVAALLLKDCPNLEYISLELVSDSLPLPTEYPVTIPLPHLRGLRVINGLSANTDRNIYDRIEAPELEWVDYSQGSAVSNTGQWGAWPEDVGYWVTIVALLRKSKKLKRLTIDPKGHSTTDLQAIVRSVPSLTHLELGPPIHDFKFVERSPFPVRSVFSWSFAQVFLPYGEEEEESNETCLPHLEVLEVSIVPSAKINDKTLLAFIQSRQDPIASSKGIAPLKKVTILFDRAMKLDVSKELTDYSESDGKLELKLTYLRKAPLNNIHFVSPGFGVDEYDCSWAYKDIEDGARVLLLIPNPIS